MNKYLLLPSTNFDNHDHISNSYTVIHGKLPELSHNHSTSRAIYLRPFNSCLHDRLGLLVSRTHGPLGIGHLAILGGRDTEQLIHFLEGETYLISIV